MEQEREHDIAEALFVLATATGGADSKRRRQRPSEEAAGGRGRGEAEGRLRQERRSGAREAPPSADGPALLPPGFPGAPALLPPGFPGAPSFFPAGWPGAPLAGDVFGSQQFLLPPRRFKHCASHVFIAHFVDFCQQSRRYQLAQILSQGGGAYNTGAEYLPQEPQQQSRRFALAQAFGRGAGGEGAFGITPHSAASSMRPPSHLDYAQSLAFLQASGALTQGAFFAAAQGTHPHPAEPPPDAADARPQPPLAPPGPTETATKDGPG